MRRPGGGGYYGGDNKPHAYPSAPPPPPPHFYQQHQQRNKTDHHQYNRWTWKRDDSKSQSPISPEFHEGQGSEASRIYYQGQRADSSIILEKQSCQDPHSQPRSEERGSTGYEANPMLQSFEGLEQKFHDDIMKLVKEQSDAEDAEIARHRERLNTINAQYQEQLVALRSQHGSRRDEFLQRETQARQQQYQRAAVDHYPGGVVGPSEPRGYSAVGAPPRDTRRSYNADNLESYRERARFPVSDRNHDFDPRVHYPGGRIYDPGTRYY